MARADLLIDLVEAERCGDRSRFRALVEAVIADERAKSHHLVADRLSALLTTAGTTVGEADRQQHNAASATVEGLLYELVPKRRLYDLTLSKPIMRVACELIEEQHKIDLLRSYNLEPRHRILLSGPPGNGKTSLAEAIASEAMLPMYVARYEGLISSFLGESASRLNELFNYVRTKRCVLFFDEFDTIAKERADEHETGEIKRLVSTLLLQIDNLLSNVVVIVATNHSELLDRAAWRRFQARIDVTAPSQALAIRFLEKRSVELGGKLGLSPRSIVEQMKGANYSDLEQFCLAVRRRYVLNLPDSNLMTIAKEQIRQWRIQANS